MEYAYSIGCVHKEASIYSSIDPSTLYRYLDQYKDFIERIDLLRKIPVLRVRVKVVESLEEDVKTTQ